MEVKMKETAKGSPNGITVNVYEKGKEYDIPEELAKVFLKTGVSEMVTVPENKDAGSSPENKEKEDEGQKKKKKK